jgi:hypothetical protein
MIARKSQQRVTTALTGGCEPSGLGTCVVEQA